MVVPGMRESGRRDLFSEGCGIGNTGNLVGCWGVLP